MVTAGDGTLRDNCAEAGPFPGPGANILEVLRTSRRHGAPSSPTTWLVDLTVISDRQVSWHATRRS